MAAIQKKGASSQLGVRWPKLVADCERTGTLPAGG
jgi:hypothetical protein